MDKTNTKEPTAIGEPEVPAKQPIASKTDQSTADRAERPENVPDVAGLMRVELVVPSRGVPEEDPLGRDRWGSARSLAEIFRMIAWPALVFVFMVVWFGPLDRTIDQLPDKVRQATIMEVAGLSLEIDKQARLLGEPELAALLGQLPRDDLDHFLRNAAEDGTSLVSWNRDQDGRKIYSIQPERELDSYRSLVEKGLVVCNAPIEELLETVNSTGFDRGVFANTKEEFYVPKKMGTELKSYCTLTPDGERARSALLHAIVSEIQRSQANEELKAE